MRVNILLVIVLPLENVGDYFVVYYLAISEGRRIYFGYSVAIRESWRIICWLLSCH